MKLNRNEKYVKWGLTAFLVIVAAGLFWLVFSNLRGFYDLIVEFLNIIAALLYGCLFAYLMNPVMKVTQRIMDKLLAKRNLSDRMAARISKITGICAAVLVFCLAVYALIALIVPNLIASIEELLQPEKLESYYATISKWFRGIFTNSDIQSFLEKTVGPAGDGHRLAEEARLQRDRHEPDELGLQRCDGHLQYPARHRRGRIYPDL